MKSILFYLTFLYTGRDLFQTNRLNKTIVKFGVYVGTLHLNPFENWNFEYTILKKE